jgi:hypothetical protein
MNAEIILSRLHRFYLAFSIFIFAGSLVELVVINHTKETLQWMPFLLSLLGIGLAGWELLRPGRRSQLALRLGMSGISLGSLVGTAVHVTGNLRFALEVNPNLNLGEQIAAALGGANPLLAPGVLGMAAVVALAATYAAPALAGRAVEQKAETQSRPSGAFRLPKS